MHGHESIVERKIRLWVVEQERSQRRAARAARVKASRDTPVLRRRNAVARQS
ncbi:MAG TPA: hypothetical protein VMG80_04100 [Solirubrobacteraceae bacterium]|nr:hypothetical protein [Solirubrobacteraceae bacterium]